ncbi:MAG TPA: hypothetical protein VK871_14820 [Candidatus Limnocylindrales bacterium]|nr:hypothetical protein [Candidatus Limnocylindrales bacterium]
MARPRRFAGVGRTAAAFALIALIVVPVLAASGPIDPGRATSSSPSGVAQARSSSSPASPPTASPAAAHTPASTTPAASPAAPDRDTAGGDTPGGDTSGRDTAGRDTQGARPEPTVRGVERLIAGSVNRTSIELTAEYDVALALGFGSRSFRVDAIMTIRNDSAEPIDRVELNTAAARLGAMKLGAVTVQGRSVKASVDDQTIVVPLGGVLGVGQSVQVRVGYSATLRSNVTGSNWLFTRTNGIVNAYRWLPWVSRRVAFDRPNHGDPFVTPVSPRVRVAITSDRALVFATTGERVAASGLRQTFEARDVRDFTFTAAPDYRTVSSTVGDTTIRVYYRPGGPAQSILSAAKNAIAKMEPLVGQYPYPTYDLAQTAGGYGMEAPGMTWIPTGAGNLSYLVTHETGHQWFYGVVGNDQASEPFTDEALTDMLARYVLGQRRASRCSTARLDLSIYRYSSACYYEIIYIQGGNFLDDIRKDMGTTAYWRAIRDYAAANRFKLAATKTLLETLDDHTTLNLAKRYGSRFPSLY